MSQEELNVIEERLSAALDLSAGHLAWALGLEPAKNSRSTKRPDVFMRYELKVPNGSIPFWRRDCGYDTLEAHDTLELCASRKLQALDAFCRHPPLLHKRVRKKGVQTALKVLDRQRVTIPGLGIMKDKLPKKEADAEGFVYEQDGVGSGKKVLSPIVHTAAMAAVTRCSLALGRKDHAAELTRWFPAAGSAVLTLANDNFKGISHHNLAHVWEALEFTARHVPASGPTTAARAVVTTLEKVVNEGFEEKASESSWSYAGAAAAAVRLNDKGLKAKEVRARKKNARQYRDHFVQKILPGMNTTHLCTCGPVSGLAPLAEHLHDWQLAKLVLKLALKDIDLFHVRPGSANPPGTTDELLGGAPQNSLAGAFVRSPPQLHHEGRAGSLRIDDTATCFSATLAALQLLRSFAKEAVANAASKASSTKMAADEL